MRILSIDTKSSSLKFYLYNMKDESVMASGVFERIGMDGGCYHIRYNEEKISQEIELKDYNDAVRVLLEKIIDLEIIKTLEEIDGIGYRVFYGKCKSLDSTFITEDVLKQLEDENNQIVANNSFEILGIRAFMKYLPNCPMIAVFDTAFYQELDEISYLYSVPYKWYKEYGVRKYGYYGIAHRYIMESIKNILNKEDLKIISCYLGDDVSISAIKNMKCVDTSMGFTPLSGVMMGTRSGDIDPSILPYVMQKEGKNIGEIIDDLNRNSGLVGLSEFSSDMRDIISKCEEGDEKAIIAKNKYIRLIVDYIAKYYILLGGCDVLCFTAGVGENCISIRREICEKLVPLGISIDLDKNNTMGEITKINTDNSTASVWVIPANEELMVARDVLTKLKSR